MKITIDRRIPKRVPTRGTRGKLPWLCLFVTAGTLLSGCQQPIYSPIAYGSIAFDGEIYTGTGNFTVTHPADGTYVIALDRYTLSTATTAINATLHTGASATCVIYWDIIDGDASFYIRRTSTQELINLGFSFTIWDESVQ